ncbi:hypothetical protein GKE82_03420 [Conexibacter sp. W3-3-2]|uniref:Zinc ribbon domain-containing protein n=1 Tax=Paraconexibacter algicola TaxID=2133960 RepID=A0A2T4UB95_9ACTN|nr:MULTISPECIES: hypothetical protein [Solirubrobacterales]MTD43377.1 hypothetical protein [Conexibacter sp. W3-3-2]PTL54143.1 hypothetical protein C7Y72_22280 [Paraconexibacter algicola]
MGGSIYIFLAVAFGIATAVIGRTKGSSVTLWFMIGAIVPGIGLLVAMAYRNDGEEPRRPCPRCGRECMLHDALCVGCGNELDYTTEVSAATR